MFTEDGKINFNLVEIEPNTEDGQFYYQRFNDPTKCDLADLGTFKNLLVGTAQAYAAISKKVDADNLAVQKALARYKFYENQIKLNKGDMFTALLYKFEDWTFE